MSPLTTIMRRRRLHGTYCGTFAPRVISQEIEDAADLSARLAAIRGHNMAKAGVDMAFWDLIAQREGKPLAKVLGGVRKRIPQILYKRVKIEAIARAGASNAASFCR
jgi:L-alanine-DL-glutamate epimerase-like enolase superfamily enzyme